MVKCGTYDKEDTLWELVALAQLNQVVFHYERIVASIVRVNLLIVVAPTHWPAAKVHVHQLNLCGLEQFM